MKQLTKLGMLFAMGALMASCSNDNVVTPNGGIDKNVNGVYMTLDLKQASTRTGNDGVGHEDGQKYENSIQNALILFVQGGVVKTVGEFTTTAGPASVNGSSSTNTSDQRYTAVGQVDRDDILALFTGESASQVTLELYAVCNPSNGLEFNANDDINQVLYKTGTLADEYTGQEIEELEKLWAANGILMTGVNTTITLNKTDVEEGHTTPETALSIGNIDVYRAVARFDVKKSNGSSNQFFFDKNGNAKNESGDFYDEAQVGGVTVEFEGFALTNMSNALYLFKNTASYSNQWDAYTSSGINFAGEGSTSTPLYVLDPKNTNDENGPLTASISNFEYAAFSDITGDDVTNAPEEFTFTTFDDLNMYNTNGDTNIDDPDDADTDYTGYGIWRYCLPNTILDSENQIKGISTGVIFKAKMTGSKFDDELRKLTSNGKPGTIYALNNIIYGTIEDIQEYLETTENLALENAYNKAYKAAYNKKNAEELAKGEEADEESLEEPDNEEIALEMVFKDGFTAYKYTDESSQGANDGGYFCYYYYWNRHNDNGISTEMGPMEFGVVRNNIYKLAINSVSKLGHPGDPDDDPDPEDPDDPDEDTDFYIQLTCTVMRWDVRQNNIDF